jgi:hypothetical protein
LGIFLLNKKTYTKHTVATGIKSSKKGVISQKKYCNLTCTKTH